MCSCYRSREILWFVDRFDQNFISKRHNYSLYLFTFCVQAQNKETQVFAALKQVAINNEEDLEDFSVEINILADCVHPNVVGLHEAFYFDGKLWVSFS